MIYSTANHLYLMERVSQNYFGNDIPKSKNWMINILFLSGKIDGNEPWTCRLLWKCFKSRGQKYLWTVIDMKMVEWSLFIMDQCPNVIILHGQLLKLKKKTFLCHVLWIRSKRMLNTLFDIFDAISVKNIWDYRSPHIPFLFIICDLL